jgi:hypothetical protein
MLIIGPNTNLTMLVVKVKVKISLFQAVEGHRVARG